MTCRWVSSDRPRVLSGRHGDECAGDECRGCLPCTEPHCRVCGQAHHETTCGDCLSQVREDLKLLSQVCDSLPNEVRFRGIDSEAMNLLGPNADPEARGHLEASFLAGRITADYLDRVPGNRYDV